MRSRKHFFCVREDLCKNSIWDQRSVNGELVREKGGWREQTYMIDKRNI